MSKFAIVDLTNKTELSSAAMSAIDGGLSCDAGKIISQTYAGIGDILAILGDKIGAAAAYGEAKGVLVGTCSK